MNTHEAYERRLSPPPTEPTPETESEAEAPPDFAPRGDSSRPAAEAQRVQHERPLRQIAWVRPSDLPTVVMTPMVGRGIDLQSELVRRARRGPVTASRFGQRVTRIAIARPEPPTPTKGVQL